ncbi:hypothetical protein PHYPSEUDO_005513 [Phytophthora pseudosyringae]|uniref:Crinkler effector protein N-terminal domain-containing protein n=1 Tax=Phytophthora pseudosyringae TaxID=221518 RepID=A0A8T1VKR5_9STRA|nr:hypothetical protein PHYPSEUDO_005513 [Phytophthora pseudosyringae]
MHLACVVVGQLGVVINVSVEEIAPISVLKETIAKEANRDQRNKPIQCSPERLNLHLARSDGKLFLDPFCSFAEGLLRGEIPEEIEDLVSEEPIDPAQTIRAVFGETMPAGVVHVFIVVPPDVVETADSSTSNNCKRPRVDSLLLSPWEWKSTKTKQREYDPSERYFELSEAEVHASGLAPHSRWLYCRSSFHEQFKFLKDEVCAKGHVGWISGYPGTGKSVTSLAFALSLDTREWIVTWIHVSKFMYASCIRLIGDEQRTRTMNANVKEDVEEIFQIADNDKRHLVLIDNWTADAYTDLTKKCMHWFQEDT